MGEVDSDMRSRGNRRHLVDGSIVTRPDGERVQVVRWEPGFHAWRVWSLATGREVLLFPSEVTHDAE